MLLKALLLPRQQGPHSRGMSAIASAQTQPLFEIWGSNVQFKVKAASRSRFFLESSHHSVQCGAFDPRGAGTSEDCFCVLGDVLLVLMQLNNPALCNEHCVRCVVVWRWWSAHWRVVAILFQFHVATTRSSSLKETETSSGCPIARRGWVSIATSLIPFSF